MRNYSNIIIVIYFLFLFFTKGLSSDSTNLTLKILTIATNDTDGLRQYLRSAEIYGLDVEVIGMGILWKGGEVAKFAGGGQKVNLLKEEIGRWKDDPETVIMFTDAYDVIFMASAKVIIQKFLDFQSNVVFAAEPLLWPDLSLDRYYPNVKLGYKYLNSGGFIGYGPQIYEVINYNKIDNDEDDQLYYTNVFIEETKQPSIGVRLDNRAHIFQNLNGANDDVEIVFNEDDSIIKNTEYGTFPAMIHGNGPSKHFLNSLGNYIAKSWVEGKGCLKCEENKIPIDELSDKDLPYVTVGLFVEGPSAFLQQFFEKFQNITYPKEKITLVLHNNYDFHAKVVNPWYSQYKCFQRVFISPHKDYSEADAKEESIKACLDNDKCEYLFMIDSSYMITNPDILQLLISRNQSIIAPYARRPGKYWSNFWGKVGSNGFYARSFDYFEIVEDQRLGIWNVPFIRDAILFQRKELVKGLTFENTELSPDMAIAAFLRNSGRFMHVDNLVEYGRLIDSTEFDETKKHPELYMLFDNRIDWEEFYLHKNYSQYLLENATLKMPCPDVFNFPMVSPIFCAHIIGELEFFGKWSSGGHSDERLNGGYENVPTVDIHMNQIGFENHWLQVIQDYVIPIQKKAYTGYHSDGKAIMNFVVKYTLGGQKYLRPHHDSSTYTINVALNRYGIDFEGGGSYFLRYNCGVPDSPLGWVIMHPGRLTHFHEGRELKSGVRYIMVSFIDP